MDTRMQGLSDTGTNLKSKIDNLQTGKKYQHLFFDLDHTLWDFDTNAKVTLSEVYEIFSLQEKINSPFENFFTNYLGHNALLWDRYHKGLITIDDLKWKRMWRTLVDFKVVDE